MLKWLAGASSRQTASVASTEIVTDDPLATICAHKVDRPLEIYAVSRVNPIFDEEDGKSVCSAPKQHGSPEFPDKSASSGYSSHRYNSSSESGAEESTESARPRTEAILRDDAITVLEQNVGFVKSILVAVRGNHHHHLHPSPRRHNRRSSAATLSPIPEGKVDYCIPRPVWPRDDQKNDSIVDDALLLYTSFTSNSGQNSGKSTAVANISSQEILRELSNTISEAIEGKQNAMPGDKLESSSEEALRKLSVTLSHREPLTKMSRALSNSSSSSGGSLRVGGPSDDRDTARLLLLQRLGAQRTKVRSSSCSTSSSGFSDLTQPPVFQHEDPSSVSNSVRNAMIYGTVCSARSGTYEKLNTRRDLWGETYCGAGVATGDVCFKSSSEYYYPCPERPDFTLDMHQAERLMRKIKSAKRRRCWCRLVTSLAGLVFFLMSVMVVSLLLTRGKRVFGPI